MSIIKQAGMLQKGDWVRYKEMIVCLNSDAHPGPHGKVSISWDEPDGIVTSETNADANLEVEVFTKEEIDAMHQK